MIGETELARQKEGNPDRSGGKAFAGVMTFCNSGKLIEEKPIFEGWSGP